jgi:hypothetical protein
MKENTIMHAFTDRLENLDVESRSTAVIAIILEFVVPDDSVGPFHRGEHESGVPGDTRDNRAGIEGENRWVNVDFIRVEDSRKGLGWQHGIWKVGSEWVFVRTRE